MNEMWDVKAARNRYRLEKIAEYRKIAEKMMCCGELRPKIMTNQLK